jgi:hypothetical protein
VSRDQFGDFQTPPELARAVCELLAAQGVAPRAVLEPTCGIGSFLAAAVATFPGLETVVGIDVNAAHLRAARRRLPGGVMLHEADAFRVDWPSRLRDLPDPLLVLGNPPWVTNAAVGALGGTNLPAKSNVDGHVGLAARTGKSNFDVSEWLLARLSDELRGRRDAVVAMLCKTTVGRKAVAHAWRHGLPIVRADLYTIDAGAHFGAAVDASLLVCRFGAGAPTHDCTVHARLAESPVAVCGWRDGRLVADAVAYEAVRHLQSDAGEWRWRSGIKHDCAAVMELVPDGAGHRNGLGERVRVEPDYLHPLLKGSELAHGRPATRVLLVPQSSTGDDSAAIAACAPRTWRYLLDHAELLDGRASSIYRNRPRFALFGVGPYSFAPWKVAIAALYKTVRFRVVGPHDGKPVVFDDTCYLLPCRTRREADRLAALLNGPDAQRFFRAFTFRDAKRPVTIELLGRLDLTRLAASGPGGVQAQHLDDHLRGADHVTDAQPLLDGVDVAHAGAEVGDLQAAPVQDVRVAAAAHGRAFDLVPEGRGRP